MFLRKKSQNINSKDLSKKINWLLERNFFSINEFRKLSWRQQYKVLKMIAKIENFKIKKYELKRIVKIINDNFAGDVEKIKLLLPSLSLLTLFKKVVEKVQYVFTAFVFVITFRSDRFELMRN